MATYDIKIKIRYDGKFETKIDKILNDWFEGDISPALEKVLSRALFIKNEPGSRTPLAQFRDQNAGMFTKAILMDFSKKVNEEESIVQFNKKEGIDTLEVKVKADSAVIKEMKNHPVDRILKKIVKLDKTSGEKKFNTAVKEGDFDN